MVQSPSWEKEKEKIYIIKWHYLSCSRIVSSYKALAKRRRKFTQVGDLGQLATSFGQGLRALALTCDDLRSTQLNASWVTSINLLLANKIEDSLP